MIVGRGSLAKLLQDREGAILFAAGVSNSINPTDEARMRELNTLTHFQNDKKCLFYFSSIGCFENRYRRRYYYHKVETEGFIKNNFENYNIIRLGNLWECTNPNTFLNYIKSHPEAEIRENEIKYMIHADELNMICQALPLTGKHEISVFSEMLTVRQCLERKNPR